RWSLETPLARKFASTLRRVASHMIVSCVGRVLPRSIWEMYSFEKRSPARSVCVRPADTRRVRTRSPRREPLGGADVPLLVVDAVTTGAVSPKGFSSAIPQLRQVPENWPG